jgi:hypothetical protein
VALLVAFSLHALYAKHVSSPVMFKTSKEWLAFVTGKKFLRSDTAAIYHFINPMLNNGSNLKVLWKGKTTNTNAEFHTPGSAFMRIDGEIFNLKKIHLSGQDPELPNKDIIYTIFRGEEVRFQTL